MIEKIINWFKKKSTKEQKATGKSILQKSKNIIRCKKCVFKNICYLPILFDKNN